MITNLRTIGWAAACILLVAAGMVAVLGPLPIALALLAGALVVGVAASLRRRAPGGPPPVLDPGQAPGIRAVRDRDGEVAAVRRLRASRPELSLLDATRMVRSL